jgi:hypothetical protein
MLAGDHLSDNSGHGEEEGLCAASTVVFRRGVGSGSARSAASRQGRPLNGDAHVPGRDAAPSAGWHEIRARLDSGFYGGALLAQMETAKVTYLCGVPIIAALLSVVAALDEECWAPCVDKDDGEVAEFGYRLRDGRVFRRYIVKRIAIEAGEQATLDEGGWRHWIFVTNDHDHSAVELESEHRHKALVEAGMRELKSNYGLGTIRRHGFMANWAWLLLVCLAHNLCCWTQQLGRLAAGRDGADLRAKRLRYRFLVVPALVVRSARQLTIRIPATYRHLAPFLAALDRLKRLGPTPA